MDIYGYAIRDPQITVNYPKQYEVFKAHLEKHDVIETIAPIAAKISDGIGIISMTD